MFENRWKNTRKLEIVNGYKQKIMYVIKYEFVKLFVSYERNDEKL